MALALSKLVFQLSELLFVLSELLLFLSELLFASTPESGDLNSLKLDFAFRLINCTFKLHHLASICLGLDPMSLRTIMQFA